MLIKYGAMLDFLKFKILFLTDSFRMGLIFDSYNSDIFINSVQNT